MDTKLKVLILSMSILCCLISNIEAQRNDMRPKEEEISSSVAERDILSKSLNNHDALILIPSIVNLTGVQMDARQEANGRRESRKFKLFDIWNKPKTSPLYLINGTVCRFVNSNPICTNLSTTGLFPPNQQGNNFRPPTNPIFNNPFGGQTQDQNFNQNQNQQNQNQQNQNQNPQNQNPNQQNQNINQQNRNQPNQRPNG